MVAAESIVETNNDFEERVRILTRLRQLLLRQREKFRTYLRALEDEGDAIRRGDVEHFEAHVHLEQSIVRDIMSFRRAVGPLEDVYHRVVVSAGMADADIPQLKAHLDHLQEQILKRNEENRGELRSRLDEIRSQVERLRIPRTRGSVYGGDQSPGVVDITT